MGSREGAGKGASGGHLDSTLSSYEVKVYSRSRKGATERKLKRVLGDVLKMIKH